MLEFALLLAVLLTECVAEDYYYNPFNVTRSTLSGIAAYRSSLTLDWLAAEDTRQRELAAAFETDTPPLKAISTDCIAYPRPAPGKLGRLMLEVLKNLEGDDGTLISELIQVLVRTKLLVDTSILDTEPDLEALVKTPGMMMGEPHTTFPRILAVIWMLVSDPSTTRKYGWCPIKKVNRYLMVSKPHETAKQMRALELVVARARFIMEEFIQNITPMNMYQTKAPRKNIKVGQEKTTQGHAMKPRANEMIHFPYHLVSTQLTSPSEVPLPGIEVIDGRRITVTNACVRVSMYWKVFVVLVMLI